MVPSFLYFFFYRFSDIMAASADRLAKHKDQAKVWLIAEDIVIDWFGYDEALRNMANPPDYNQPDHYAGEKVNDRTTTSWTYHSSTYMFDTRPAQVDTHDSHSSLLFPSLTSLMQIALGTAHKTVSVFGSMSWSPLVFLRECSDFFLPPIIYRWRGSR
jgi:Thermolysin metallopeptidase, alpha-helical domain